MRVVPTTRLRAANSGLTDAIPAILSWTVVIATVLGVLFFPHQWLAIAVAFLTYFIARSAVHFAFYVIGELKCRAWRRRDWTATRDVVGPDGFAPSDVWHVVLLPNYTEPEPVLRRTLSALAAQHDASTRVVAVLGMEEREDEASEKAARLAAEFEGRLARVIVSVHPANLPGELPCKAANMRWAAQIARDELDRMGVALDRTTITSCDADSVFDPRYFAAVAELFVRDERRHARFWQAPMFYYNNLWSIPAPVRFTAWYTHAGMLAELAMPGYDPLPISTYTLSMKLAEECDWWDPAVISEDWHIYLDYLVQRRGDVSTTSIFLPVHSDSVEGDSYLGTMKNRYTQVLRHCWGAEDVGFLAEQVRRGSTSGPVLFRLAQVTHDHVFRVASWCVLTSIGLVSGPTAAFALRGGPQGAATLLPASPVIGWLFTAGGVLLFASIAVDLARFPARDRGVLVVLAELVVMWLLLPVLSFTFGFVPALHAQTKLALGLPLWWKVTPKRLRAAYANGR